MPARDGPHRPPPDAAGAFVFLVPTPRIGTGCSGCSARVVRPVRPACSLQRSSLVRVSEPPKDRRALRNFFAPSVRATNTMPPRSKPKRSPRSSLREKSLRRRSKSKARRGSKRGGRFRGGEGRYRAVSGGGGTLSNTEKIEKIEKTKKTERKATTINESTRNITERYNDRKLSLQYPKVSYKSDHQIYENYGMTFNWHGIVEHTWLDFTHFALRMRKGKVRTNDNELIRSVWIDLPAIQDEDYECILLYINLDSLEGTLLKFYPFEPTCLKRQMGLANSILSILDAIMAMYKVKEATLTDGLKINGKFVATTLLYERGFTYYNARGWMPVSDLSEANNIIDQINTDRIQLNETQFSTKYSYKYKINYKRFIYVNNEIWVTTFRRGRFVFSRLDAPPLNLLAKSVLS